MTTRATYLLVSGIALLASSVTSQAALVIYDGVSPATSGASLHDVNTGEGWRNPWDNQGGSGVYSVLSSAPLTFGSLETTAEYAQGGGGWLSTQRYISTSGGGAAANAGWVASPDYWSLVNQGTVWVSLLVRRETTATGWDIGFTENPDGSEGSFISVTPDGNFSIRNGWNNPHQDTGVSATVGTTFLIVMQLDLSATSTVNAWAFSDPASAGMGGANLTSPMATFSTDLGNVRFNRLFSSTANSTNAFSFDEIRLGTDYASVTPVPEPATWGILAGALTLAVCIRKRLGKGASRVG